MKTKKNMWDERFSSQEYIYGKKPNEFLAQQLTNLKPGRILFPGEGEGRNACYAAINGWETHAFDSSVEGQKKALQLATSLRVEINYQLYSYSDYQSHENTFDCIALIFAHIHKDSRQKLHRKLAGYLKPGGVIILEAFEKNQLGRNSGGPQSHDLLYSIEELADDFKDFEIEKLNYTTRQLDEGSLHKGEAALIQLLAYKKA